MNPDYEAQNRLLRKRDELLAQQTGVIMSGNIPVENLGSLYEDPGFKKALTHQDKVDRFHKDLRLVLNRHSIDADLEMPDFIIADFLVETLSAVAKARHKTAQWGVIPRG